MKKLLATAAGVAMLLSTAMPALASHSRGSSNTAIIIGNDVTVVADTGLNSQGGLALSSGRGSSATVNQNMTTGNATATGGQVIVANANACGCSRSNNKAVIIGNDVSVGAYTGSNSQEALAGSMSTGGHHHHGSSSTATVNQNMTTGDASATGRQLIVTNVSLGL